jgi:hypothetical protein
MKLLHGMAASSLMSESVFAQQTKIQVAASVEEAALPNRKRFPYGCTQPLEPWRHEWQS